MKLELRAKLTAGKLLVTGSDLSGASISLSEAVPTAAFLALPGAGAGGAMLLPSKLSGMKVGGKRNLTALDLSYFPAVSVAASRYEVERGPDAAGHRVFNVTMVQKAGDPITGKLVVDTGGVLVEQTLDSPVWTSIKRREQQALPR